MKAVGMKATQSLMKATVLDWIMISYMHYQLEGVVLRAKGSFHGIFMSQHEKSALRTLDFVYHPAWSVRDRYSDRWPIITSSSRWIALDQIHKPRVWTVTHSERDSRNVSKRSSPTSLAGLPEYNEAKKSIIWISFPKIKNREQKLYKVNKALFISTTPVDIGFRLN